MIEAYCNLPSYVQGEPVDLHVRTAATNYTVEIIRQGAQDRCLYRAEGLPGRWIEDCVGAVADGCNWPVSVEVQTDRHWPSGAYLIRLIAQDGSIGEAFFVLRPAARQERIAIVLSTSTYQAYNDWGGANAYAAGEGASYSGGVPILSWRRPLARGLVTKPDDFVRIANVATTDESVPFLRWAIERNFSIWTGAAGWGNWECPFVRWAEAAGYRFDYLCSHDLDRDPHCLDGYALFLSVGHDEYWSARMRDHVEAFVAAGGNACFFSGNTSFWQVRFDEALRMIAYKSAWRDDPVLQTDQRHLTTGMWSNPVTGRPENQMTGVSFTQGGYARVAGASPRGPGGFIVYRPEHWVFAGTGLRYGDLLGSAHALVGYEVDGCRFTMQDGMPVPTGVDGTPSSFEILGLAPAALLTRDMVFEGYFPPDAMSDAEMVADQVLGGATELAVKRLKAGHATMGVFERGGTVFTAATTEWACALAGGDGDIERITRNLLHRLSGGQRPANAGGAN